VGGMETAPDLGLPAHQHLPQPAKPVQPAANSTASGTQSYAARQPSRFLHPRLMNDNDAFSPLDFPLRQLAVPHFGIEPQSRRGRASPLAHDSRFTTRSNSISGTAPGKVQAPVDETAVDAGIHGIQQELFAMHGAGALIGGKNGRAHPLEVTNLVARDAGMNVSGLRREGGPHFAAGDRLREIIRRQSPPAPDKYSKDVCGRARRNRDRWPSGAPVRTTSSSRCPRQSEFLQRPACAALRWRGPHSAHKIRARGADNPRRGYLRERRSRH
jgi:hypothetical protein